jgi:general nucleoside transport system permease protein
MTVSTMPADPEAPIVPVDVPETAYWSRARKAGVTYILLGLLAALFWGVLAKHGGDSRFTLATSYTGAALAVPSRAGAIVCALITAAAGVALVSGRFNRRFAALSSVAVVGLVLAFLCWQVSGNVLPIGSTVALSVTAALPLIFGSLSGVMCERSGVINVAIEGQFLTGAFLGAFAGTLAHSAWIGLVAGILGGVLVGALLAVLAIKYMVDQVVLGVLLNLLALGLTSFLYGQLMQPNAARYNTPPLLPTWSIPGLSRIPVIGPTLFSGTILLYLAIVLVIAVHVALFHTRWGLRTRAVGEHPTAADTVGINVRRVRYRNVLLGGVMSGLGGAYFTIGSTGSFGKNMTVGLGFIALAALIFGRWSPVGAMLATLLFGFTAQIANYLGAILSPIPTQFLGMLPYAVTILAVAGFVGRVRAPAADGKPYTTA